MKLKKTWIGVCVFVIYLVGIIFATGVTGFVSGLLPAYGQLVQGAVVAVSAAVIALIVSFAGNSIGKSFIDKKNRISMTVIEALSPILLCVIGIIFYYESSYLDITGGNMALYEGAKVTGSAVAPVTGNFLDYAYMMGLHGAMLLLGNGSNAVIIYHIALRAVLLLCMYFSLRLTMGILGAYVSTILMIAIPVFANSLSVINSANLFFSALSLSTMFTVMLIKGMNFGSGKSLLYTFLDILVGLICGVTVFMDLSGAMVLVFAFFAFFIKADEEKRNVPFNWLLYLISGICGFVLSFIGWYGSAGLYESFWKWANQFYGINRSVLFELSTESVQSLTLVLVLLTCGIGAAFAYIFSGRCERVIPWFLFIVISSVLSVVLGHTVINDQVFIVTCMTICVGCLMSCFAYYEDRSDAAVEADSETEFEESEEVAEEVSEETDEDKTEDKSEETDEDKTEEIVEEEKQEIPEQQKESPEKIEEKTEAEPVEKQQEKPRFVPEGMVLPMGEEDEESLVPNFNLKRQQSEDIGIISLNRDNAPKEEKSEIESAPENTPSAKAPVKDDFDISIEPGDDFDI